jgi:hypothetical protein
MKPTETNPAAGQAGIARLVATEHHCPGVPELGRAMVRASSRRMLLFRRAGPAIELSS